MLIWHLLYPSELSSVAHTIGFEPMTSGFPRRSPRLSYACTVLLFSGTRDTQSAPRRPGPTARTKAEAKGRAYDAEVLLTQAQIARRGCIGHQSVAGSTQARR